MDKVGTITVCVFCLYCWHMYCTNSPGDDALYLVCLQYVLYFTHDFHGLIRQGAVGVHNP